MKRFLYVLLAVYISPVSIEWLHDQDGWDVVKILI
jgi:hypothetical protein